MSNNMKRETLVGRFDMETAYYDDGSLYRIVGPFGMTGDWHEDEYSTDFARDFLTMCNGITLSDAENNAALGYYEMIHDI